MIGFPNYIWYEASPSHGHYYVDGDRIKDIPPYWRKPSYEEDVDVCILVLVFAADFPSDEIDFARRVLRDYYPDEYAKFAGQPVQTEQSKTLRRRAFYDANKDKYVVVSAVGGPWDGVPAGWVRAFCVRGGYDLHGSYASDDQICLLIARDEYRCGRERSEFGLVIEDPDRYERADPLP